VLSLSDKPKNNDAIWNKTKMHKQLYQRSSQCIKSLPNSFAYDRGGAHEHSASQEG